MQRLICCFLCPQQRMCTTPGRRTGWSSTGVLGELRHSDLLRVPLMAAASRLMTQRVSRIASRHAKNVTASIRCLRGRFGRLLGLVVYIFILTQELGLL